jgi:hypothetical protein
MKLSSRLRATRAGARSSLWLRRPGRSRMFRRWSESCPLHGDRGDRHTERMLAGVVKHTTPGRAGATTEAACRRREGHPCDTRRCGHTPRAGAVQVPVHGIPRAARQTAARAIPAHACDSQRRPRCGVRARARRSARGLGEKETRCDQPAASGKTVDCRLAAYPGSGQKGSVAAGRCALRFRGDRRPMRGARISRTASRRALRPRRPGHDRQYRTTLPGPQCLRVGTGIWLVRAAGAAARVQLGSNRVVSWHTIRAGA